MSVAPLTYAPVHQLLDEAVFGKPQPLAGDADSLAETWLQTFSRHLSSDSVAQAFADTGSWRDLLCFQWDFRTVQGPDKIAAFVAQHQPRAQLKNFRVDSSTPPRIAEPFEGLQWLEVFVRFDTALGSGRGVFRLVQYAQGLQALSVFTMLDSLTGHEEHLGPRRPTGVNHGQHADRESYADRRARECQYQTHDPTVVIVGGGQAGLTVAARLKVLGVDSLIVEKNPRIGDNWRKRYQFLVLHDPVWYDHLPYLPFPESWPVYTPKDKLADFFEFYVKALDLNVWTGATARSLEYSESKGIWTMQVQTSEGMRTLRPRHVVQATGHSGEPAMPVWPEMANFEGTIVHSSGHGSGAAWKGKRAVVVGCCNSGLDIAHDFYEQGAASVTVVQRSSTCVVSADGGHAINNRGLHEEGGPETAVADLLSFSTPLALKFATGRAAVAETAAADEPMLRALEARGFKLDFGYGGAGVWSKYMVRGGGYYLDVGAAALIGDGRIKLKRAEVAGFTSDSVVFSDGDKIDADIVVCATGYQNMRATASRLFGDKVAERLQEAWGLDEEMELRAVFRQSGHPGYWYAGGNLALCRFYSKMLALQIVGAEMN